MNINTLGTLMYHLSEVNNAVLFIFFLIFIT